jgi:hypothetical protein
VSAPYVEALVIEAVRKLPSDRAAIQADVRDLIDRVTIGRTTIQVQLSESTDAAAAEVDTRTLTVPWMPPSPYRKREIIHGPANGKTSARPMRAKARGILLEALGHAHTWLDQLISDLVDRPPPWTTIGAVLATGVPDGPNPVTESTPTVVLLGRRAINQTPYVVRFGTFRPVTTW